MRLKFDLFKFERINGLNVLDYLLHCRRNQCCITSRLPYWAKHSSETIDWC